MKSILIVICLCCLLLIISGFAPSRHSIQAVVQVEQCPTPASKPQIHFSKAKKSKLSGIPRWHQVIPGMFH
ncbi:MAG: hypothetical protein KA902_03540 [Arenimonas sp.]|nr:hypothetical protein [Arenimonas sp.]